MASMYDDVWMVELGLNVRIYNVFSLCELVVGMLLVGNDGLCIT